MEITNLQQLENIASSEQLQTFTHDIFNDIYLHTLFKRFRLVYKNQPIDKLNNAIFNLSETDKEIIYKKSFNDFKKYTLKNNDYDLININNEFIYELFNKYLPFKIKNYIQQMIAQYNDNVINNKVTEMNELSLINIPIGKSINLNLAFYENLHKFFIIPIIYANGNIISMQEEFSVNNYIEAINTTRQYHHDLLNIYLHSRKRYHNNDIEKISRSCTESEFIQNYAYARIVYDGEVFIIMSMNNKCNNLIQQLHNQYQKPIFIQNDNATQLTRAASKKSRLKYKQYILYRAK